MLSSAIMAWVEAAVLGLPYAQERGCRPVAALRRKLRAIASLAEDAGATGPRGQCGGRENPPRATAARGRGSGQRLGRRAFRFGRWAQEIRKSAVPASTDGDWTGTTPALLGKTVPAAKSTRNGRRNDRSPSAASPRGVFYEALRFEATHPGYKLSFNHDRRQSRRAIWPSIIKSATASPTSR